VDAAAVTGATSVRSLAAGVATSGSWPLDLTCTVDGNLADTGQEEEVTPAWEASNCADLSDPSPVDAEST
jgi:hypothetical protein